jgi:hypothetical protein
MAHHPSGDARRKDTKAFTPSIKPVSAGKNSLVKFKRLRRSYFFAPLRLASP